MDQLVSTYIKLSMPMYILKNTGCKTVRLTEVKYPMIQYCFRMLEVAVVFTIRMKYIWIRPVEKNFFQANTHFKVAFCIFCRDFDKLNSCVNIGNMIGLERKCENVALFFALVHFLHCKRCGLRKWQK